MLYKLERQKYSPVVMEPKAWRYLHSTPDGGLSTGCSSRLYVPPTTSKSDGTKSAGAQHQMPQSDDGYELGSNGTQHAGRPRVAAANAA